MRCFQSVLRPVVLLDVGVCILRLAHSRGIDRELWHYRYSHTPSTGKLFSRLTILNLRFVMPQVSHRYARIAIPWEIPLPTIRYLELYFCRCQGSKLFRL
jgi:hypothetical protein